MEKKICYTLDLFNIINHFLFSLMVNLFGFNIINLKLLGSFPKIILENIMIYF